MFSLAEVRLGILPSVISPYVLRAIGPRFARDLFLTGDRFDAAEAHRIGLVHQVVAAGRARGGRREKDRVAAEVRARGGRGGEEADRAGDRARPGGGDAVDGEDDCRAARLGGGERGADGVSREAKAVVVRGERMKGTQRRLVCPAVRQGVLRLEAGRSAGRAGEVLLLRPPVRGRGGAAASPLPLRSRAAAPAAAPAPAARREAGELTMRRSTLVLAVLALASSVPALAQSDPTAALIERVTGPSSRLEAGSARPDRRDRRPRHRKRRIREGPEVGRRRLQARRRRLRQAGVLHGARRSGRESRRRRRSSSPFSFPLRVVSFGARALDLRAH